MVPGNQQAQIKDLVHYGAYVPKSGVDWCNKMVNEIQVKSILNKHKKRDDWFLDDYSVNPYYGCQINCLYCYIRGSKYGTNMGRTLSAKMNAPSVLRKQVKSRARKKEYGIIFFSSQEAYLPIEKKYKLTRRLLDVALLYRFPVHIATKSTLVLRDLELLKNIDRNAVLPADLIDVLARGVIISFSFSSLDEELGKIFETGAPPPEKRLETMRLCKEEGFLVGVNLIPVLPFLSDSKEQVGDMIRKAKAYGADFVRVGSLNLYGDGPADSRTLFFQALGRHFPELILKYKELFHTHPSLPWSYQKKLEEMSIKLCEEIGIKYGIV